MKTFIAFWYILLAVVCYLMTFGFDLPKNDLPQGWSMQTNGREFRWIRPNGSASIFTQSSRQSCCQSAWEQMKYENRDKGDWRAVEDWKESK